MSQYGNIGQLNIEINSNAELAVQGLEKLSNAMKNLTFGDVSGLKEFTKELKKLSKVQLNDNLSNTLKNLQKEVSGLNFEVGGLTDFVSSIKKLGNKSVDNAISKIPLLSNAMSQMFRQLSSAPHIRTDIINMTNALANFTSKSIKVSNASSKISKGMDKIGKSAKKNKGLIEQFFAGFNAGNFAGNFTANIIAPLIRDFAKGINEGMRESLEYASDLVETQNVLERTFGDNIDKVNEFSKTALQMYGMNELEAKKMIGTFQAMGTALGETKERMADVSTSLGALVGDYASFFNMNVKDVANDFTAIFTGQTKAMRKYGIDLTNAQLQDFADKQGWDVQVKSLNQYNKAIIRYNYLVSRSQDILGDFQRTQGSYANQVKLLSQQFRELFGTLGQIGTAVLTPILQVLNAIISKISQFAEQLVAFLGIDNFINISGGAVDGLEDMADGLEDVENSADGSAKALKKLKTYSVGIDELNVLKPNEDTSKSSAGAGAGELGAGWDTDWWDKLTKGEEELLDFTELLEHLEWVFEPLVSSFKRLYEDGIKPFVESAISAISELWHEYFENFLHWLLREFLPPVIDIATNLTQHFTDGFNKIKDIAFNTFEAIANSGWGEALVKTVTNIVTPILDAFATLKVNILSYLEPIVAYLAGVFQSIGTLFNGIVSNIDITGLTDSIKDFSNELVRQIEDSGIVEYIKSSFNYIQPFVEHLGYKVGDIIQGIIRKVESGFEAIKPFLQTFNDMFIQGLYNLMNGTEEFIYNAESNFKKFGDVVSKYIGDVISIFNSFTNEIDLSVIIEPLANTFKSLFETISKYDMAEYFGKIYDRVLNISKILASSLGITLQQILEIAGKIINVLSPLLNGAISFAIENTDNVLGGIETTLTIIRDNIKNVFDGIQKIFADLTGMVEIFISKLDFSVITEPIQRGFEDLQSKLQDFDFAGYLENIHTHLKNIGDIVANQLGSAVQNIMSIVGTIIDKLAPIFNDSLVSALNNTDAVLTDIEKVLDIIGGALNTVLDFFHQIITQIDLSVILTPLREIGQIIFDNFQKAGIIDKVKQLGDKLQPVAHLLGEVIGKVLQLIFTLLGEIFKALKPIIDFVSGAVFWGIGKIIDGIAWGLEKIQPVLSFISDTLTKITDMIKGAGDIVGGAFSKIIGFFTGGEKETEVNVEVKANTESVKNDLDAIETNKEVNIEVKANTEDVKQEIDSIGTDKQINIEAKVDKEKTESNINDAISGIDTEKTKIDLEPKVESEKVSKTTTNAIEEYVSSNPPKIEITPEIKTESVTQAFDELNENVQIQGEKLNETMSNIGTTANTTLNTTFTNNNATLIEIITENANTIKTTFEDAKIGLGIKGNTSTVFEEYGLAVVNGFKAGIEKNKQISINAVSVWVKDIMGTFVGNDVEGINYNVWFEYAHQVMLGFAEGITTWSYIAKEAIRKWVAEMMEEFEGDMEIDSPSKVFADYGYYTVAGFNKGIEDNQSTTTTIIKDWVGDIEKQIKAIENFNVDMSNTIKGLDNLTARVNTQVDMSGFYGELEKAQTMGMNASLNSYAENRQAIEVNIPNITLEVDSREIARANYKGQKELGYQIKK